MKVLVEKRIVKVLMTQGVIIVPKGAMIVDVVGILVEGNVHAVIVTDDNNEPVGVVSEVDIPKAFGEDFSKTPVTKIMSTSITTIGMDEKIEKAGEIMKNKGIHQLIVVDGAGRMHGVVAMWDIVMDIYDSVH